MRRREYRHPNTGPKPRRHQYLCDSQSSHRRRKSIQCRRVSRHIKRRHRPFHERHGGPRTEFLDSVAVDLPGNIYVTTHNAEIDPSGPFDATVRIYSANTSGSAKPTRIIKGVATGLALPSGVGIDSSGLIYVPQEQGFSDLGLPAISVFAANAGGNVAPIRTITGDATTLSFPGGPAFDSSNNVYVTNTVNAVGGPPDAVVEFSSTASGNVAPIRRIAGAATTINTISGIALDGSGNIYVSSFTGSDDPSQGLYVGSILVFSSNANGDVAPVRTISGSATMLHAIGSVKVDSAGNIFVTSDNVSSIFATPAILKFAPNANGNVAPIATITSSVFTQPINDITIH